MAVEQAGVVAIAYGGGNQKEAELSMASAQPREGAPPDQRKNSCELQDCTATPAEARRGTTTTAAGYRSLCRLPSCPFRFRLHSLGRRRCPDGARPQPLYSRPRSS